MESSGTDVNGTGMASVDSVGRRRRDSTWQRGERGAAAIVSKAERGVVRSRSAGGIDGTSEIR